MAQNMVGMMWDIRAIEKGQSEMGIILCAKCGGEMRRGLCVGTKKGPICIFCIDKLVEGAQ